MSVYLDAAPLLVVVDKEARRPPRSFAVTAIIARARKSGRVSVGSADELFVKFLGVHPADVYGRAWWSA